MFGRIARGGWFVLGWVAVGLGGLGVVVPGLPTTGFFVLAAGCFSRSSPRFEQWVLDRPGVGPLVRDYRAGLGMPRTAKVTAITSMTLACSLSAFLAFDRWPLRVGLLGLGAVGTAWILWKVPTRAEPGVPPPAPAGRWFRAAAFAEAATWLALLVAMAVKHLGSGSELGVQVVGPVHGVVVLGYVAMILAVAPRLRWDSRTTSLAVLASVPPLGTVVFETWAGRAGALSASSDPAQVP